MKSERRFGSGLSGLGKFTMIHIKLRLSESLLCILKDVNNPKDETIHLQAKRGTTIKEILLKEKINPLIVPMVTIGNTKIDIRTALEKDVTVTLFGPLAGG